MRSVITLTTDFGLTDPFVGIMKGVILNLLPNAQIIDISHQIEPQNIRQAALTLESAHSYFPKTRFIWSWSIRGGQCKKTHRYQNQILHLRGTRQRSPDPAIVPSSRVYALTKSKYFLEAPSSTFHGRDVFAPAAAWIAKGTALSQMGQKISDPCVLEFPQPKIHKGTIMGEIISIDRFGISSLIFPKNFC